ncbi:sialidase family protein [soil metagenome]
MQDVDLFRSVGRYRAVRIPAIVAVGEHTLLVVAVGRHAISDWGPSDLLMRRSVDGGATWSPQRVLQRGWWRTVDNPTLVVDRAGSIHLFFQTGYRRLWHRVSTDGGASFGRAIDRSAVVRAASTPAFSLDRFAPGPGTGALLQSGRLVVPVWAASGRRHRPSVTLTIVSDDEGQTWRAGDLIAGPGGRFPNPSEATVAPTHDGGVVLSFRQRAVRRRVFSWSGDGATGWSRPEVNDDLFEPVCHAALAAVGGRVAFVNPDSRASTAPMLRDGKAPRENLTLRWSSDAGHRWPEQMVLDTGPSGYASLVVDPTDRLHVVWEYGRLPRTAVWPTSIRYRNLQPLVDTARRITSG